MKKVVKDILNGSCSVYCECLDEFYDMQHFLFGSGYGWESTPHTKDLTLYTPLDKDEKYFFILIYNGIMYYKDAEFMDVKFLGSLFAKNIKYIVRYSDIKHHFVDIITAHKLGLF